MSKDRIDVRALLCGVGLVAVALLSGCPSPGVGDPCVPEQIPTDGYSESEAYIESSSVQCKTRVCMSYLFDGDPRDCEQLTGAEQLACMEEVEKHIYCTCRCYSGGTGFEECDCPSGFQCVQVLEQGGPGVRGGYCVRNGTFLPGNRVGG